VTKDSDSKDCGAPSEAKGVARNLEDEWGMGHGAKNDPEDSMEAHADAGAVAKAEAKGVSISQAERKQTEPDSPTAVVRHTSFQAEEDMSGAKGVVGEVGDRIDAAALSATGGDRMPVSQAAAQYEGTAVHYSPTSNATGKPVFFSPLADAKNAGNGDSIDFGKSNSTMKAARPHHLPRMGSANVDLSKKMDDIRRGLADGDGDAPWDESGKPLPKKKKKKAKKAEDKDEVGAKNDL